jgi:hypothetical protein
MNYKNMSIIELICLNESKDAKIERLKDALTATEMSKNMNQEPDYQVLYMYLKRQILELL